MKPLGGVIALLFALSGCASPIVSFVKPTDDTKNGVRVRQVIPY